MFVIKLSETESTVTSNTTNATASNSFNYQPEDGSDEIMTFDSNSSNGRTLTRALKNSCFRRNVAHRDFFDYWAV